MDTGHGPEGHREDYSFMQETFKDEKLSPKKIIVKTCKWIALGILFGAAACITFFALRPWAEEAFQEEPNQVEIQQNEDEFEQNELEQTEEPDVPEEPDTPDVQQPEQKEELTIKDYFILSNELKKVALEAQKSVVKVTGILENADWTSGADSVVGTTSGLIIADNGRELLIFAKYSTIKATNMYQVEFVDGSVKPATLKQKDQNLDMAVFCVSKDDISEETWERIAIAKIGNSERLGQGSTVIAVGQPFGIENGLGYGIVSSLGKKIVHADGEYAVIATDMNYSANGNGFLVDIYGSVAGVITSDKGDGAAANLMMAYGISDIINIIELMSNGKQIPYAGIIGTIVTEETSELYGIPVGLYVTDVEEDSPAMKAGIQNGDVITSVGTTAIESLDIYHDALYELEPGNMVKFIGQRYGTEDYVYIDFTVTIGIKE